MAEGRNAQIAFTFDLGHIKMGDDFQLEHYRKYEMFIEPEERTIIHESNMIPTIKTPLFTCKYYLLIQIDHGLKSELTENRIPDLILPFAIYPLRVP